MSSITITKQELDVMKNILRQAIVFLDCTIQASVAISNLMGSSIENKSSFATETRYKLKECLGHIERIESEQTPLPTIEDLELDRG